MRFFFGGGYRIYYLIEGDNIVLLLNGGDKVILTLRPGITGPATLHYRKEEELLARQIDPEKFNKEVIYPHKLELNKKYILEYSLLKDIRYIIKTVLN